MKNFIGHFDLVILADGDYPTHAIPLGILNSTERLYCCDHAGLVALENGLHPAAIVGDGDSLSKEQKDQFGALYHQIDEQDYNDLTKALRFALSELGAPAQPLHTSQLIPHPQARVAFLGATGKREDHTLGNISLMMWYYRRFPVLPTLWTDHGVFTPATGRTTFISFPGQQVSIYNFGCSRLESEQLKWNSYAYEEMWQGGLNEALADTFTLDGDSDYLVFQTYEKKP